MNTRALRLKIAVSDNLVLVLSVCLLLVLFGGYLTYTTHVEPGVETEQFEEASWSSTAELTHGAMVTTDTLVFPEGTVLQNRDAYLVSVMPVVNGTIEYTYQASDGGEIDVQVEQTAILRSVEGQGEEEGEEQFEHWRMEESLATTSKTGVSPGDSVAFPFSLNVSEQLATGEEIESELGGTPGSVELLVVSELSISGVRNGEDIDETHVYETTITVDGNTYRFEGEGPYEEGGEQVVEREVTASYGPLRSAVSPLLLAVGLLGGVGVIVGSYRGALAVSQAEREWLAYRTTCREYEEWISTGHIADDALPPARVSLDSLDGLVDVAIDSNRRVIHDRQRGYHLVIVDETAYTYNPPASLSRAEMSPLEAPGETIQSLEPVDETDESAGGAATESEPGEPQFDADDIPGMETATDQPDGAADQDASDDATRGDSSR